MRQILKELNDGADITGSMVITQDGIMVAAALGSDLEEDAVAAFSSSLLVSMKRGLSEMKVPGEMTSCTLAGTEGKITFFEMKNSYLVVLSETEKKLDSCARAVQEAIHKIQNRRVG